MGRVERGLKRGVSCVNDSRGRKGRGGIHGLCSALLADRGVGLKECG